MKRIAGIGVLAAAALLTAGCAGGQPAPDASGGSTGGADKVTVAAVVTISTAPLWVAEAKGIWAKYGLDVTIQGTQNFAAAVPSLLNGQVQFATGAVPPFLTAVDQGLPIRAVGGSSAAAADPEDDGDSLVVPADSPFQDIRDLKGMTLATNAIGAITQAAIVADYVNAGGEADDLNWVVMDLSEMEAAMDRGDVDGAAMADPFTAQAKADGFRAWSALRQPDAPLVPANAATVVVVASQQYLAANADVAARFQQALIEANDAARADPDLVVQLLVEKGGMTQAAAEGTMQPAFNGKVSADDMQAWADAMYTAGLLTKKLDGTDLAWTP